MRVIDLHHVAEPPEHVRRGLREIFGKNIAVLYEADWPSTERDEGP
ncbi:hypothetical protein WMF41_53150 [Sorangium sp. So ce1151]